MVAEAGTLQLPPLALYVHLPWCVRKCPYCDFNSHQLRGELPAGDYSNALIEDLEQDLPLVRGRPVSSLYFGGGTPSLFGAEQVQRLLSAFRARLNIVPGAEITLEANPGTVERDSFAAYREAGINRISLGVQSFDDGCLRAIGRIHGRDDVDLALESLHQAGFENFNADLMFGLPGQSGQQAVDDVRRAIRSGAAHISHYQLTIEPNTEFAAKPPWRYGDFLGIGAGAHAKISDASAGSIRRLSKTRHPRQYLAGDRVAENRCIDDAEKVFEFFLNTLRLREGFTREQFTARTGLEWAQVVDRVDEALDRGLLKAAGQRLFHTESGWRFVNDIQAMFLP
jgi:oxygen-independent coproporphyrinogen-3 oxidase